MDPITMDTAAQVVKMLQALPWWGQATPWVVLGANAITMWCPDGHSNPAVNAFLKVANILSLNVRKNKNAG